MGDFHAGITGDANELHAVLGEVVCEGIKGALAPPRGGAAQWAGARIGWLVEHDGDQGNACKRGGFGRAAKGLVIV